MLTDQEMGHVETMVDGALDLQSQVNTLQLSLMRLEEELRRQPERRGFADSTTMTRVFERLYRRAEQEHRAATSKERRHELEDELDALARALNWSQRVP